ncbi:uncharacterized protein [Panulirus ornatus]|uniref:uncharacterized protein isoform X2 n=1 Tax=Panulirus ornatus TaxID=150431 RepID=UPI003A8456A3
MSYRWDDLEPSLSMGSFAQGGFKDIDDFCQVYLVGADASWGGQRRGVEEEEEEKSLQRQRHFKKLKVHDWKGKDFEAWAVQVLHKRDIDCNRVDLWRLRSLSGRQHLLQQDFCDLLGEEYGSLLHQEFQRLRSQHQQGSIGISPEEGCLSFYNDSEHLYDFHDREALSEPDPGGFICYPSGREGHPEAASQVWDNRREDSYDLMPGGAWHPMPEQQDWVNLRTDTHNPISGAAWHPMAERQDWSNPRVDTHDPTLGEAWGLESDQQEEWYDPTAVTYDPTPLRDFEDLNLEELEPPIPSFLEENNHQVGTQETSCSGPFSRPDLVTIASDMLSKIQSNKKRNRYRGPKNWELLVRMLADERTNPSVIRWEDESAGTFRLMQPNFITLIWATKGGDTPRNTKYINFARGLRYHYSTGVLYSVSERQYVYGLGPKGLQYLRELQGSHD